jgi:hypothetical protein
MKWQTTRVFIAIVIIGILVGYTIGLLSKVIPDPPPLIHVTIKLPASGRWNYTAMQSLLEAYTIEDMGHRWNKGEWWTGHYIEALIKQSNPEDTTLNKFKLQRGQKIEFDNE